jgi:hypothetical protein
VTDHSSSAADWCLGVLIGARVFPLQNICSGEEFAAKAGGKLSGIYLGLGSEKFREPFTYKWPEIYLRKDAFIGENSLSQWRVLYVGEAEDVAERWCAASDQPHMARRFADFRWNLFRLLKEDSGEFSLIKLRQIQKRTDISDLRRQHSDYSSYFRWRDGRRRPPNAGSSPDFPYFEPGYLTGRGKRRRMAKMSKDDRQRLCHTALGGDIGWHWVSHVAFMPIPDDTPRPALFRRGIESVLISLLDPPLNRER